MDPTGTPSTIVAAQSQKTSHVTVYLRVFVALLVLTLLEYLYARFLADVSGTVLIGGLMLIAVVKAVLVGLFFMHLLFEGPWKYLMLVPTAFFAAVVVLGLVPDIALPPADPGSFASDPPAEVADRP